MLDLENDIVRVDMIFLEFFADYPKTPTIRPFVQ